MGTTGMTFWRGALELQQAGSEMHGSPFYAALLSAALRDLDTTPQLVACLERTGAHDLESALDRASVVRLLGGVHECALAGEAPAIAAHFPSTGGDGDADAAWKVMQDVLASPPNRVVAALTRDPQTNEVARSALLAGAIAVVADAHEFPVRLFEIGTSAGLNLLLDHYCFTSNGRQWGDASSPVRFVDAWRGASPPFDPGVVIAARRGCDLVPLDASDPEHARRLLSYIWPDQHERFTRLRAALEIAAHVPVVIDTAPADVWLRTTFAPEVGTLTVLMHSIMWQYVPAEQRRSVQLAIETAGARATSTAPVAWLRMEPRDDGLRAETRATVWPGATETVLAESNFHGGEIDWIVEQLGA